MHTWAVVRAKGGSAVPLEVVAQLADHLVDADIERFSGMFTMVHLEADGTGWVTADPLGTAMAYSAETPTHSVVTNRAALAASLVTPPGRRPVRDLEGVGQFAFTGSFQGGHTGFDAVRVIPQGSIVHLAGGRAPRTNTWSAMPWWVEGADVDLDLDTRTEPGAAPRRGATPGIARGSRGPCAS